MPEIFTQDWADAWCRALNQDPIYARVARTWEGSLLLVMEPDPAYGLLEPRAVFVDLWHGRCRGARAAGPEDEARAAFILKAPAAVWYRLLSGEIGPIPALVRGQLKLTKGNLMALLPYVRAAQRLVAVATQIGTTFPKTPSSRGRG